MFWVSLVGVGMNFVLMGVLGHGSEEGGSHGHGHSHSHGGAPKRKVKPAEPAPGARAAC